MIKTLFVFPTCCGCVLRDTRFHFPRHLVWFLCYVLSNVHPVARRDAYACEDYPAFLGNSSRCSIDCLDVQAQRPYREAAPFWVMSHRPCCPPRRCTPPRWVMTITMLAFAVEMAFLVLPLIALI
jgi:hypothetical protein